MSLPRYVYKFRDKQSGRIVVYSNLKKLIDKEKPMVKNQYVKYNEAIYQLNRYEKFEEGSIEITRNKLN